LGLGAGFAQAEYDKAGIRFDAPSVRVDRLEEAIQVLKGLLGAGPLTFTGKHFSVTDLDSFPKPMQRPHPPIHVGAAGKRMLSIAAREADTVGFQTVSTRNGMVAHDPSVRLAKVVAEKVEQVRHMAGDRFGRIELSMVATMIALSMRSSRRCGRAASVTDSPNTLSLITRSRRSLLSSLAWPAPDHRQPKTDWPGGTWRRPNRQHPLTLSSDDAVMRNAPIVDEVRDGRGDEVARKRDRRASGVAGDRDARTVRSRPRHGVRLRRCRR
jgi:alkanesulfonate monooxygenase SsuD/methylene tetrahydromethanopterin reductase-like flavin-dependent oxidoreductase (luciferase family)